jgi:hypothetical protein
MMRAMKVLGRVFSLRLVTAAYVAALLAESQMHPVHPELETLLASLGGVGRDIAHLIDVAAPLRGR